MKENSWILVANHEKAKVYRIVRVGVLEEVTVIISPDSQQKAQDATSDRQGQVRDRVGYGRSTYQPETTFKQKQNLYFAKDICHYLELAKRNRKFSHLYIVAEPQFMGYLKKEMTKDLESSVDQCFAKDMVHLTPEKVWQNCPIVV